MNKVFISLGSNMGNLKNNLSEAITLINTRLGKIISLSSLYETAPWEMAPGTNNFLNQVILAETQLPPEELIDTLLDIEKKLGRSPRSEQKNYESRIIDLDVLFYNNISLSTTNLTIPHPYLHKRKFVLEPLAEIAPLFVHPVLKKSIQALLKECEDPTAVEKTVSK